ncbi:hypothetical protein [Bradyrhizobium sp. STM 3557]|uniref:hypothetical protein n=1 Tax=Bradyrhizobium sp. STM 3557 TaxID=578920 RepID=UPI00388DFD5C
MRTLRLLPMRTIAGYTASWPAYCYEFEDLLAQQGAGRANVLIDPIEDASGSIPLKVPDPGEPKGCFGNPFESNSDACSTLLLSKKPFQAGTSAWFLIF